MGTAGKVKRGSCPTPIPPFFEVYILNILKLSSGFRIDPPLFINAGRPNKLITTRILKKLVTQIVKMKDNLKTNSTGPV